MEAVLNKAVTTQTLIHKYLTNKLYYLSKTSKFEIHLHVHLIQKLTNGYSLILDDEAHRHPNYFVSACFM